MNANRRARVPRATRAQRLSRREFLEAAGGLLGLAATDLTSISCVTAVGTRSDYVGHVLAKNPAAYWRLGEAGGLSVHDATFGGHEGVVHGTPTFREPGALANDPDTAIGLNGASSYVEVPDSTVFSQATSGQGLTVEAWVRPDVLVFTGETADPYVQWLGKGEAGSYEWGLRFYSQASARPNRISAYIWNAAGGLGAGAYFQDALRPGEWIHVVACYAPGNASSAGAGVSIYKNGVLRGSPASSPGALYSTYNIAPVHGPAPVRLGTLNGVSFLTGGLDEVAIYPRVLTPAEILDNHRSAT